MDEEKIKKEFWEYMLKRIPPLANQKVLEDSDVKKLLNQAWIFFERGAKVADKSTRKKMAAGLDGTCKALCAIIKVKFNLKC